MTPINVMVESVAVDYIETSQLGAAEPDIVSGKTRVRFRMADGQSFDIDWTWRGDPPPVGSKWTLGVA